MSIDTRDTTQAGVSWLEHQMLEHIKGALRVTVNWNTPHVGNARKRSSIAFAMKSFERHLERLMAIEEEGGYMYMVADAKPNTHERIKELREEHDYFRREVRELQGRLKVLEDWQADELERVCDDIRGLLDDVDHHDQAEVKLLQETLLYDEGGEG